MKEFHRMRTLTDHSTEITLVKLMKRSGKTASAPLRETEISTDSQTSKMSKEIWTMEVPLA